MWINYPRSSISSSKSLNLYINYNRFDLFAKVAKVYLACSMLVCSYMLGFHGSLQPIPNFTQFVRSLERLVYYFHFYLQIHFSYSFEFKPIALKLILISKSSHLLFDTIKQIVLTASILIPSHLIIIFDPYQSIFIICSEVQSFKSIRLFVWNYLLVYSEVWTV